MAGLQANAHWFPLHRLAAMNGWVLAGGGVGAVFSTAPVEWALQWTHWRILFTAFAMAFAMVSALILDLVPERTEPTTRAPFREQLKGFVRIGGTPEFWRIAPLATLSQSMFMSLQGLWAAGWMKDVGGYSRETIAEYLLLAALAMVAGHLTMGNMASRPGRTGSAANRVVGVGVGVAILVQALLAFGYTGMPAAIWILFGFLGTAGTVSFALLAKAFPVSMVGRANTTLNLMIFVATFLVQWGMGVVINRFPGGDGRYEPEGYGISFGIMALLQAVALIGFLHHPRRDRQRSELQSGRPSAGKHV
jgi:MFS family permease